MEKTRRCFLRSCVQRETKETFCFHMKSARHRKAATCLLRYKHCLFKINSCCHHFFGGASGQSQAVQDSGVTEMTVRFSNDRTFLVCNFVSSSFLPFFSLFFFSVKTTIK